MSLGLTLCSPLKLRLRSNAMPTTARVVGLHIDQSAIVALLNGKVAQDQMDAVAKAVLAMQRSLVPVLTTRLLRSLEIRTTPDGVGRLIGSFTVEYAIYVELGHQTKGGTWVPAQPFIRPSIDAARVAMQRGRI
jgi:hypothetical protein